MSRINRLLMAMGFLVLLNGGGFLLFDIEPMSATNFLISAFVAAWCGEKQSAEQS